VEYSEAMVHRGIVVVDVESFGDPQRTNAHQAAVRDGLYRTLETAFSRSEIPWEESYQEDRGDGALILVSPNIPKNRLVESLPHALIAALREHNAIYRHEARIRLRMALHAGEVHRDNHGVVGTSINHAFRLLEAAELKSALAQSQGTLAIATSSTFYDEVVRHSAASNPAGFQPIRISVKETAATAWIYLPEYPHSNFTLDSITNASRKNAQNPAIPISQAVDESATEWTKFAIVDHEMLFGIDDTVKRLGGLLKNRDGDWVISIFGSPGAGKTTLAYEVVKRYADLAGFRHIAWISAKLAHLTSLGRIEETRRTMIDWREILLDIAQQLRLDIEPNPMLVERELERALSGGSHVERCLIVIDNLETMQDAQLAVRYLEKESVVRPHKVILTSRQSVIPYARRLRELRWDGLAPRAAQDYAKYLLQDDPSMGLTLQDLDNVILASECNPLLIKLIVRLAMFERRPVDEVASRLRNIHANLGENVASYLYAGSLAALDSQVGTEAAVKLMNVFCSRAPGESFTVDEFYRLSRLTSREDFDRAKAVACQLALVRTLHNNTMFTVHSLLREFVCSEPPESHHDNAGPEA
jgi:hypothetical protein